MPDMHLIVQSKLRTKIFFDTLLAICHIICNFRHLYYPFYNLFELIFMRRNVLSIIINMIYILNDVKVFDAMRVPCT